MFGNQSFSRDAIIAYLLLPTEIMGIGCGGGTSNSIGVPVFAWHTQMNSKKSVMEVLCGYCQSSDCH